MKVWQYWAGWSLAGLLTIPALWLIVFRLGQIVELLRLLRDR